jgi:hypothetical protein
MPLAGSDLQSVTNAQGMVLPIDLDGKLTLQHIKELPRTLVEMPLLLRAWRHALLYDA